MGQITIRELEKLDFFEGIPQDILQNLLNESTVASYKKKEVIFHSRTRTEFVNYVISLLFCNQILNYNCFSTEEKQKGDFYPGKRTTVKSEHCEQKAECSFW